MIREIDIRMLASAQLHAEIFSVFDALQPSEGFVILGDQHPMPLLERFQSLRAGTFEWNVLEAVPGRFRVEVRRREAQGPRNVTEYLQTDHRRLDAIMTEVRGLAGSGSFRHGEARFAEFRCGLDRHIDVEEQVLFPLFERLTGMSGGGPTFVMRGEHAVIRRLMEDAAGALEAADRERACSALDGLASVLVSHNLKEERILYPMTDRAAGGVEACDDLVRRLQAHG